VVTRDGDVFGIPAHGSNVLRIKPSTSDVHTLGQIENPGDWMWHGAALAANGSIYAIPRCMTVLSWWSDLSG
jgi:hypothetical protein